MIPPTAEQSEYLDEFQHQLEIMDLMIEKTLTRIAKHPERDSDQNRQAAFHYQEAADQISHAIETIRPLHKHFKPRHVDEARQMLESAVLHTVQGTTS